MEQIQQLLDMLKETPEMALWGVSLYFLFILLKLASWVYAIKSIAVLFIKRFFENKESERKKDQALKEVEKSKFVIAKDKEIAVFQAKHKLAQIENKRQYLDFIDSSIYGNTNALLPLFSEIAFANTGDIKMHFSDIEKAVKTLREVRKKNEG